jgi:hypothetical protein
MADLKYEIIKKEYKEIKDLVSLPKFQRDFVWGRKKQEEFIETIKRGLPIGTLLLAYRGENQYSIVDGRQRMTTLKNYDQNSFSYIKIDDIEDITIFNFFSQSSIIKKNYDKFSEQSKNQVLVKTKQVIYENLKNSDRNRRDKIFIDIRKSLLNEIPILGEDKDFIDEQIVDLVKEFTEKTNIDNIQIPAILFKGSNDEIVEAFINLNQKGTKLSKYDIFAAEWQKYEYTIKDESILNIVVEKYKAHAKLGIEIEGFDEFKFLTESKVNIYEYAYAISKIIRSSAKTLFNYQQQEDETETNNDSIGFSVLTGIFNISNKDMSKLPESIKNFHQDLKSIKEKIVETVKEVEETLRVWVQLPTSKHTNVTSHSELQVASYIITLFKLKHTFKDSKILNNTNYKENETKFKRYLHKHYIYDILRGYWSGSGDTKLDNLTLDISNSPYFGDVAREPFIQIVEEWLNYQNTRSSNSISSEAKLFLNFILVSKIKNQVYDIENLDFDHIIPKNRFKKITGFSEKISVSSINNIALIPAFDNRRKRDKTYYELEKDNSSLTKLVPKMLELHSYPVPNEINFIESTQTSTIDNYYIFLKNRKNLLLNEFTKGVID